MFSRVTHIHEVTGNGSILKTLLSMPPEERYGDDEEERARKRRKTEADRARRASASSEERASAAARRRQRYVSRSCEQRAKDAEARRRRYEEHNEAVRNRHRYAHRSSEQRARDSAARRRRYEEHVEAARNRQRYANRSSEQRAKDAEARRRRYERERQAALEPAIPGSPSEKLDPGVHPTDPTEAWELSGQSRFCGAHFVTDPSSLQQQASKLTAQPCEVPVPFVTLCDDNLQGVASNQDLSPLSEEPRDGSMEHPHTRQPPEDSDGEESSCLLRVTKDLHFGCCSCTYVTSAQQNIITHLLIYAGLGCQTWKETRHPTKTVKGALFSCCFCGHASRDQCAIIGHLIAHSADRLTILAPALCGPFSEGVRLESTDRGSQQWSIF
ncbi:uncharacterized protein LOC115317729 [Ixodes scapularis]|uniref:uncharacterized protein LOC115317729 n=1 Tax=Ixodes scapularis TaxID=6945 RepID=UPI001C382E0D|nr:uncharacterized protein LOC115317729 [Ixodes scapularis]